MKLYKYIKFGTGKTIIETSKITLSKPAWFNDPFDCVPASDDADLKRAASIMSGFVFDRELFKMVSELKEKIKSPKQRAALSLVTKEYTIAQELAAIKPMPYSPIFTFDTIRKLYRLCERMGKISLAQAEAMDKIAQLETLMEKQEWDILTKMINMRDGLYISCLSSVYDSILMWSYYGEDHRGVCLELEVEGETDSKALVQVEYSTERPIMQTEKIARDVCGNLFARHASLEENSNLEWARLIMQPIITKAKDWEHEKEYRLVFSEEILEGMHAEKITCDDGKERYLYPVKVTKVFFGANMTPENKEALRKIIPAHIEIVEMKISDAKYELLTQ